MTASLDILWTAPAQMLSALVLGAAFALGHHFFYHSLDGQPTPNTSYDIDGVSLSRQQINVAAGTVFAFLVKALLGVAVSTACDQSMWKAIKARTTKIGVIDNLFAVLSGFTVLNLQLWRRYPLTMLLASIFWVLPVASFFTPATLTVHLVETSNSTSMRIPQVDFTSLNFANMAPKRGQSPYFIYNGPQYAVQRVVVSTAAEGQILPISAPAANSSWLLNFAGPALSCNTLDGSLYNAIIENVLAATETDGGNGTYTLRSGTLGPVTDYSADNGAPIPADPAIPHLNQSSQVDMAPPVDRNSNSEAQDNSSLQQKLLSVMNIIIDDLAQLSREVYDVAREICHPALVDQTQLVDREERYRHWKSSDISDVLVIDVDFPWSSSSEYSPFSRVCWHLVANNAGDYKILYFFCSKHKDPGSRMAGPMGMLKAIIAQLLSTEGISFDELATFAEKELRENNEFEALCSVLEELMMQYRGPPVIMAIDGTDHFERAGQNWTKQVDAVMRLLLWTLLSDESAARSVFRLLITSGSGFKGVFEDVFPPEVFPHKYFMDYVLPIKQGRNQTIATQYLR
ncbi:hypothetical protein VTN77DRAFT_545 [Rasamsonia byssochlamydoides]|uniref:uncharacterized protein n=1 Tax=Rasamsonia byssochlamydoides TaxID=89139 RepID=UPI00374285D6